jgi:predicted amidohydrolase
VAKKIIRAAVVQTKPIETSVEDTIFHAIRLAKKAAEKEVDIICLPEHWLPEKLIPTPYEPSAGLAVVG